MAFPHINGQASLLLFKGKELDAASLLLGEKGNCRFISGYASNKVIQPVTPTGLFDDNTLDK